MPMARCIGVSTGAWMQAKGGCGTSRSLERNRFCSAPLCSTRMAAAGRWSTGWRWASSGQMEATHGCPYRRGRRHKLSFLTHLTPMWCTSRLTRKTLSSWTWTWRRWLGAICMEWGTSLYHAFFLRGLDRAGSLLQVDYILLSYTFNFRCIMYEVVCGSSSAQYILFILVVGSVDHYVKIVQ